VILANDLSGIAVHEEAVIDDLLWGPDIAG
jgi:hypothetical protein